MATGWNSMVWSQFGASIDALKRALEACPETLWERQEFWYLAYHTLFWTDCYLSESPEGFAPPPPFNLDEMDPAGVMPERAYTKEELLAYLAHCRTKCWTALEALTDDQAAQPCRFERLGLTVGELHLYNMRHVQHGAAQLNLHLRQTINSAPRWVFKAGSESAIDQ